LEGFSLALAAVVRKHKLILFLILFVLVFGAFINADFGQSWDEYTNYMYGEIYLKAYTDRSVLDQGARNYFHGPFYFMLFSASSKIFASIVQDWSMPDGRHFSNFLTYLVGLVALYFILIRFVKAKIAFLATALFTFQPLLFGHAFINQKDIPFMAFFTASISLGLLAVDKMASVGHKPGGLEVEQEWAEKSDQLRSEWRTSKISFRALLLGTVIVLILFLGGFFLTNLGGRLLSKILKQIYEGSSLYIFEIIFGVIAEDAYKTPLSLYIQKLDTAIYWLKIPILIMLLAAVYYVGRKIFRNTYQQYLDQRMEAFTLLALAGMILGMTSSIRLLGGFAGLLVAYYAYLGWKRKAIMPILVYAGIALLMCYFTWPAIWGDPVSGLWSRARSTVDFEMHTVLFEGQNYPSTNLPHRYLPVLMAYQFTEPFLLLLLPGFYLLVQRIAKQKLGDRTSHIILLWFAVPFLTQIINASGLYGNYRHFLFILPPLAVMTSLGMEFAADLIKRKHVAQILATLMFLPSAVAIVSLHPYEYIYYNSLVTAVPGKVDNFENDYWCTSYREAMRFVNEVAPKGSIVAAWGPSDAANAFARDDIEVTGTYGDPDYFIGCKWSMNSADFYPEMDSVFEIRRRGALLGIVKEN
jgi:4-amino-4-deoxy-L-arabinose transferase-like glycosyltransferase